MIAMQYGLAASASRNCVSMVSGLPSPRTARSGFDAERLGGGRGAVWRGSVAPSPGWPPICMYMVMPLPGGSAAIAVPAATAMAAVARSSLRMAWNLPWW